jgi:hypothetical protein
MLFALAASLLAHLSEDLPTAMTLDDPPPAVRESWRPQEEEPQRPRSWSDAQVRRTEDHLWSLTVAPTVRLISGKTRVRELDSRPIWLDLGEPDFGFGPAPGIQLALKVETRLLRWFIELDLTHAQGRGKLSQDYSYDEGNFVGAIPYRTHADLIFARAGFEVPGLIWQTRNTRISPLLGVEYPRMSVGIDQKATGSNSSEQYEQFIPVPIAGIAVEQRIASSLMLTGRFYFGGVPNMPTPFQEGGRLRTRVLTTRAELELSWQLIDSIRLFAGAGYQYWTGRLWSFEDGNNLRLETPILTVGLDLTF